MRTSRAAVALALLLASAGAWAQEKETEKDKEKEKKPPAQKVYTNEDLAVHHPPGSPSPKPGSSPSPVAPQGASPSADPRSREEVAWRLRAARAREAVRLAERKVAEARQKAESLVVDVNPIEGTSDPFRQQSLEQQRAQAAGELSEANKALERVQKAWDDLQEEARRAGVPPGWLRE